MTQPEFVTIGELFQNYKYSIPLYQREYAWTIEHISQLISDIASNAVLNIEVNYYLGTLVLFDEDGKFQTIDGQQRLTTLFLLLCYLKQEGDRSFSFDTICYDSRDRSTRTLKAIFNGDDGIDNPEPNIIAGWESIQQQLENICKEFSLSTDLFIQYLEDKVQLLKVFVPKHTDLNHYFEIMNVRGEQLEKHEVLKSRLMDKLDTDQDRHLFSKVWDSCSDMNKYLQLSLVKVNKDIQKVFGKNWNDLPSNYQELRDKYPDFHTNFHTEIKGKENDNDYSLEKLLITKEVVDPENSKIQEEWSSLTSVINFPNFLLQVLSVFCPESDIALDDKRLLEQFEPYYSGKTDKFSDPEEFVKEFCFALFKSKYLFDKYVIKNREENNETEWLLRQIRPYKRGYNWVETFGADEGPNNQESIIMLQSMFHVSFPTRNYKNWFTAVLNYLYNNENRGEIKGNEFKTHLLRMSDSFYFDRDGEEPLTYRTIIFENNCKAQKDHVIEESFIKGVDTKNFVFNRLDYKLWEKRDEVSWPEESKKLINSFKFTFRSSVEHFYPRNPNTGLKAVYNVDRFGNLCLIDRGKNSQLSNNEPLAKLSFYKNTSNIDSLKLQLMMGDASIWAKEEAVERHENTMKELLNSLSV